MNKIVKIFLFVVLLIFLILIIIIFGSFASHKIKLAYGNYVTKQLIGDVYEVTEQDIVCVGTNDQNYIEDNTVRVHSFTIGDSNLCSQGHRRLLPGTKIKIVNASYFWVFGPPSYVLGIQVEIPCLKEEIRFYDSVDGRCIKKSYSKERLGYCGFPYSELSNFKKLDDASAEQDCSAIGYNKYFNDYKYCEFDFDCSEGSGLDCCCGIARNIYNQTQLYSSCDPAIECTRQCPDRDVTRYRIGCRNNLCTYIDLATNQSVS